MYVDFVFFLFGIEYFLSLSFTNIRCLRTFSYMISFLSDSSTDILAICETMNLYPSISSFDFYRT